MIALDIGGTKIACAMVDGGALTHADITPTPAQEGPEALMDAAWRLAQEVHTRHLRDGGRAATQLAVASAGVIDPHSGFVTSATDAIAGWAGTDLRGGFAARSGMRVGVINDVHAHTLGEYVRGRGRGRRSMLLIAVGTGIGGGLIVDGRLALGESHVCGHVGHLDVAAADGLPCSCGRSGHLEAVASGTGIERRFADATGVSLGGGRIARLALTDEPHADAAKAVLRTAGYSLGRVVGGLLNALDPGLVVLAGSVATAGQVWLDAVAEGVADAAMPIVADTDVVLAELGGAALVGAAAWLTRGETP